MAIPIDDEGRLRRVLDYLGHELDPSILIGGWATNFRVGGDISRDIDLIIGSHEVREKVRSTVKELSRSHHHKWRGEVEGVHVDIYLPHQSELGGRLRLRVEVLAEHTDPLGHRGWQLLTIEAHVVSKFAALLDRPDTEKGFKDAREIRRLLDKGVDAVAATRIMAAATAGPAEDLPSHVAMIFELLEARAGYNKAQKKDLHQMRRVWADAIAAAVAPPGRDRPELD